MKITSVIAFLWLLAQLVSAQNSLTFSGRIFDNSTKDPLPYATISVPNTGTGVISNEFGEFVYHIPDSVENNFVEISFLGFETSFVIVNTINSGTIYQIGMSPKTVEINEVKITA